MENKSRGRPKSKDGIPLQLKPYLSELAHGFIKKQKSMSQYVADLIEDDYARSLEHNLGNTNVIKLEECYEYLVCFFFYYDVVLEGLIQLNGHYYYCSITENHKYNLLPVEWDERCEEFLEDYRSAYPSAFFKPSISKSQFDKKWSNTNPITDNTKRMEE